MLKKSTASGTIKIVPKPEQRANLICRVHQDVDILVSDQENILAARAHACICGWVGMFRQVQEKVAACVVCDRIIEPPLR
jgi:hypothetical protein